MAVLTQSRTAPRETVSAERGVRPGRVARQAFRVLAWLFALGIVIQFALAGISIFVDPRQWVSHVGVGHAFVLPTVGMIVLAFAAKFPRRTRWLAVAAFGLMMVQGASAAAGGVAGAVHPVNALLLFWVSLQLIREPRGR